MPVKHIQDQASGTRHLTVNEEWTKGLRQAWDAFKMLVKESVPLNHSKRGQEVLMFPDASNVFRGSRVAQVPSEELANGMPVEAMDHKPMGFVSGPFEGSKLHNG